MLTLSLLVAILALALAAGVVFELRSPLRARPAVLVSLSDGTSAQGVLWRRAGRFLVLRDARLHQAGGAAPVDGELIVDRARVLFVQRLP